jgi:acyl-CoA synthetase (AMP-forming)/AMP-acid ligase II
MRGSHESNFAGRLVARLRESSVLIEAATGKKIHGREIARLIVGFGSAFLASGLQPGDRVLISCGLDASGVLAYLGSMYAGCVPVLVHERVLAASGKAIFTKARAKAAWTGDKVRWDFADNTSYTLPCTCPPCSADSVPPCPRSEDDLAVLMPTSGSTGVPRLVMVTHGNLTTNTEAIIRSQQLGSDEIAMLIMPVSYCFGASILHTHLYQGGGVVLDSRFIFPDKVLHALNTFGCTTFAGVPTVYNVLLRRSNLRSIPLPRLRRFLQAGGALAVESAREMRSIVPTADFLMMYGQTEATARIACLPPGTPEKLGTVGLPLDNLTLRVVDDMGQELPLGEIGEIQVRGPSVCAGYFDDPEATEQKFGGGWLKTGDLGCSDEQGFLLIKGRASEFVKIRGYRVSLAEVEAKVSVVPGVCECAAAGVEHPEAGESLALFIVKDPSAANGSAELIERVRRALPSQWTCKSVKVVSELPRTENGKLARPQLQTLA